VDTLFTLISPTVRAHLRMLSMISFAVRDEQFRQVLRSHGSREEIFEHARRVEQCFPVPAATVEHASRES
jgi:PTS system nitrogen regulatory IIA component